MHPFIHLGFYSTQRHPWTLSVFGSFSRLPAALWAFGRPADQNSRGAMRGTISTPGAVQSQCARIPWEEPPNGRQPRIHRADAKLYLYLRLWWIAQRRFGLWTKGWIGIAASKDYTAPLPSITLLLLGLDTVWNGKNYTTLALLPCCPVYAQKETTQQKFLNEIAKLAKITSLP